MKKLFFVLSVSVLMWSCGGGAAKKAADVDVNQEVAVVTIDDLLATPDLYLDNEVTLTGLCVHVCAHGGKMLKLAGENDGPLVLVVASGEIEGFTNDLEGETLIVTGMLTAFGLEKVCEGGEEHEVAVEKEGHVCPFANKEKAFKLECVSFEVVTE